jgi:hypothetical protein
MDGNLAPEAIQGVSKSDQNMTSFLCRLQDLLPLRGVNYRVIAACGVFAGIAAHSAERLLANLVRLLSGSFFGNIGRCGQGPDQQTVCR